MVKKRRNKEGVAFLSKRGYARRVAKKSVSAF